ncbi:MAG: hypothetical protein M0Q91_09925 [Methanoregula sp.]|nr:hypothetical protein [Methanoregula sp.]
MSEIQYVDDPALSAGFHDRVQSTQADKAEFATTADKAEFATTADKILGLLKDEPISVELMDGIFLEFYPPTDEQFMDLITIQVDGGQIAAKIKQLGLSTQMSDEETAVMMPQAIGIINQGKTMLMSINEMLATLAVDPSWTAEKFKQLPRKYKSVIIAAISDTQNKEAAKTKKFRKK